MNAAISINRRLQNNEPRPRCPRLQRFPRYSVTCRCIQHLHHQDEMIHPMQIPHIQCSLAIRLKFAPCYMKWIWSRAFLNSLRMIGGHSRQKMFDYIYTRSLDMYQNCPFPINGKQCELEQPDVLAKMTDSPPISSHKFGNPPLLVFHPVPPQLLPVALAAGTRARMAANV